MSQGSVFRRCGCRDQLTGRLRGAGCPELSSARHGSWYFSIDLPAAAGGRRRMRRGGFASRAAAAAVLEALRLPAPAAGRGLTTGQWLERWLASRLSLRASTKRGYAAHVRTYLLRTWALTRWPGLGRPTCRGCSPPSSRTAQRWAAVEPGHVAADRRDGTRGAERSGPGRADRLESWPLGGTAAGGPAAAAGLDAGPDPAVGAGGLAPGGGGVDPGADRRVLASGQGPPAVRAVPPGRAARAAPRRGVRAAVVRFRSR